MAQPKQQTTRRRTGNRRSHLLAKLRRAVNRTSPVKAVAAKKVAAARPAKSRPAVKKAAAKKPSSRRKS